MSNTQKTRNVTQRIGLFGGTFDPPHRGHLAVVNAAMSQLSLDRVFVIPARVSPLKQNIRATSGTHRSAMLRLLFEGHARVRVTEIELRRRGTSFTVDTVRAFKRRYPASELILIIGEDNLRVFDQWRHPGEIVKMASLAVYKRKGSQEAQTRMQGVAILRGKLLPISATDIRRNILDGKAFSRSVTPKVAEYIRTHQLFNEHSRIDRTRRK